MEINVRTMPYLICNEMIPISLEKLYDEDIQAINDLRYTLSAIINTEAPITLNLIKVRLREAFGVKKISDKALYIIMRLLNEGKFPVTDNLYDKVYWPEDGIFMPKFIRIGYERQIYDIAYQELAILTKEYLNNGLNNESLYREILAYYGYSVLTNKARNYLEYVERMVK